MFYRSSVYLFFTCFLFHSAKGQNIERQVFASCGTTLNSGNIWLDYTIGEMAVVTYSTGSIVLNQGFHQVNDSNIGISNLSSAANIKVFPNPSRGYIEIDIPDEMTNNSSYRLTDIAGRIILDKDNANTLLLTNKNTLNISDLPYGIYLLSILVLNTNSTYIYRIIKI